MPRETLALAAEHAFETAAEIQRLRELMARLPSAAPYYAAELENEKQRVIRAAQFVEAHA